jgi:hypothetical protein
VARPCTTIGAPNADAPGHALPTGHGGRSADQSNAEERLTESAPPVQATAGRPINLGTLTRSALAFASQHPLRVGVWTLVVVQAIWFWFLMRQGWFYQADFENLASAAESSLTWDYVVAAQGGHLGLVGRPMFWLLQRGFGLNYGPTVLVRIALQMGATLLLARLVFSIAGKRLGVLAVLAAYCFSPLLIPGTAWLTSGIGLTLCQVLFIQTLISWLRFNRSGRLRDATAASACLALSAATSDSAYAMALIIPMLSVGWGYRGNGRARLRAVLHQWFGWLLLIAPVAGLSIAIVLGGYADAAASPVAASGYLKLFATAIFRVLFPSAIGGPWRWSTPGDNYLAFADPPLFASIAGGVVWVAILIIGLRRVGRVAVLAWAMPSLALIATMALVGAGRYNTFGTTTALAYRYTHLLAVPLALSVALMLCAAPPEPFKKSRAELAPTGLGQRFRSGDARWTGVRAASVALALTVSGSVSSATFTHEWSKSPAHAFVSNLRAGLATPANRNAYDTYAPDWLIPAVEVHRHVSDILSISGSGSKLDPFGTKTKVAQTNGHLVSASFLVSARATRVPKEPCVVLAQGVGTWTATLNDVPRDNEWFLRLEYYQQRPSTLQITIVGETGSVSPVPGTRIDLRTRLDAVWLRLPRVAPRAVTFASTVALTNICLTKVEIGYPFPAGHGG